MYTDRHYIAKSMWTFDIHTQMLVRSGPDVGRGGQGNSQSSNSCKKCSVGLRSGLCAVHLIYMDDNQVSTYIWPISLHITPIHCI